MDQLITLDIFKVGSSQIDNRLNSQLDVIYLFILVQYIFYVQFI